MVDGAGEGERDVSLARVADLCLAGKSSLSSLSYGADLDLARSALTGFPCPLELQQPLPQAHVLTEHLLHQLPVGLGSVAVARANKLSLDVHER